MFEAVNGDDHVHRAHDVANKLASVGDSILLRLLSRMVQPFLRDVEADHTFSPKQCHLPGLRAWAASEIKDDLIPDLRFNTRQENSQLALSCVGASIHRGRQAGSNSPQETALE